MKFSQMPYERPDLEKGKALLAEQTEKLKNAQSFAGADEAYLAVQHFIMHQSTMDTIAKIRHDVDTADPFYEAEVQEQARTEPLLQESKNAFDVTLLSSPFRPQFEEKYGALPFVNLEIEAKAFDPAIVPELQEESRLCNEYTKLIASAQIPFEGGVYTLSQLTPFKQSADDAKRRAAWEAEGRWYMENGEKLDEIYDKLVSVRTAMARKMGYDNYIPLGYLRMQRNCYDQQDVERFRAAVRKYLVPVAEQVCRKQAARLGVSYPMTFDQEALFYRSGNANPKGTPAEILEQGRRFYHELSPETAEFIDAMLDDELMDVESKKGKAGGGYCTSLFDYKHPFIFANFNGTQHDVEVITHEAGHAFAGYMARDVLPIECQWPTLESCEIHSMSMEFFAWPWAEGFFGEAADKFRYKHLSSALTFIPYGTMVDHFQHEVYAHPEYTPEQRHDIWRELLKVYMPWMRRDSLPFYGDGRGWQRQQHIYRSPFYYIDYCLAQTVALQFWALIQNDRADAWSHYMDLVRLAGTRTFRELVAAAGLDTPFGDEALAKVADAAQQWLDAFDAEKLK